jgi:NTP pyrophosphatase (non-canonical NTP hydrolase)
MRAQYLARIAGERERQDEKFKAKNANRFLSRYISITTEELGEVAMEVNDLLEEVDKWEPTENLTKEQEQFLQTSFNKMETELIQTAACCLLLLEMMRSGQYRLG